MVNNENAREKKKEKLEAMLKPQIYVRNLLNPIMLLCVISIASVCFAQEDVQELSVSAVKSPEAKVTKIQLSEKATIVTVQYTKTKSSWSQAWVKIASSAYIQDRETADRYPIRQLRQDGREVELDSELKTKEKGVYELVLVFWPLRPGVRNIDIIEPGGWRWNGIEVKNSLLAGCPNLKPESIAGNAETGNKVAMNFLEISSDKITFVGKSVETNGMIRIGDTYKVAFEQAQTSHYAFEALDSDGLLRGYLYFKRGDDGMELRRQVLNAKNGRVCGNFTFDIPQRGFDPATSYFVGELLKYAPVKQ